MWDQALRQWYRVWGPWGRTRGQEWKEGPAVQLRLHCLTRTLAEKRSARLVETWVSWSHVSLAQSQGSCYSGFLLHPGARPPPPSGPPGRSTGNQVKAQEERTPHHGLQKTHQALDCAGALRISVCPMKRLVVVLHDDSTAILQLASSLT